jgi:hypothetical protein
MKNKSTFLDAMPHILIYNTLYSGPLDSEFNEEDMPIYFGCCAAFDHVGLDLRMYDFFLELFEINPAEFKWDDDKPGEYDPGSARIIALQLAQLIWNEEHGNKNKSTM